jgi:xylan 1,4-beta-xylosidase
MNMSPQLKDVAKGFDIVSRSAFKGLPIYITEADPEGCAACGMTTNPENAYRNGVMYSSYTAASFARIYELAARYGVNLRGAISWSFEFEDQRWFDGFRDLATNGVDKPVLNVFRMYGMMLGRTVPIVSDGAIGLDSLMTYGVHGGVRDVNALAVAGNKSLSVMAWNYIDEDLRGEASMVRLSMSNIPFDKAVLRTYVIDEDHSNAYTIWKRMGMPQTPDSAQIATLEKSGQLAEVGAAKTVDKQHAAALSCMIPVHGVILLRWTW